MKNLFICLYIYCPFWWLNRSIWLLILFRLSSAQDQSKSPLNSLPSNFRALTCKAFNIPQVLNSNTNTWVYKVKIYRAQTQYRYTISIFGMGLQLCRIFTKVYENWQIIWFCVYVHKWNKKKKGARDKTMIISF